MPLLFIELFSQGLDLDVRVVDLFVNFLLEALALLFQLFGNLRFVFNQRTFLVLELGAQLLLVFLQILSSLDLLLNVFFSLLASEKPRGRASGACVRSRPAGA